MPLADFQAQVRGAIVEGALSPLAPVLTGGRDPNKRFAIHQRHYQASLLRALTEKFPATVWLVGSEFVTEAARQYVHLQPPSAPCIAEYGASFPEFLAGRPGAERVPALRWLAELEWHLGHAALALEQAPLAAGSAPAPARLPDCRLRLQPGLRYLAAPWPVDELINLFLCEQAPEQYALAPRQVFLEIRGARGAFSMLRLDAGAFSFRRRLAAGASIGDAAEAALDADPAFDIGAALFATLAAGLITALVAPDEAAMTVPDDGAQP